MELELLTQIAVTILVVAFSFWFLTKKAKVSIIPERLNNPESGEDMTSPESDSDKNTTFEDLLEEITAEQAMEAERLDTDESYDASKVTLEDDDTEAIINDQEEATTTYQEMQTELESVKASIKELNERLTKQESKQINTTNNNKQTYKKLLTTTQGAKAAFIASEVFSRRF